MKIHVSFRKGQDIWMMHGLCRDSIALYQPDTLPDVNQWLILELDVLYCTEVLHKLKPFDSWSKNFTETLSPIFSQLPYCICGTSVVLVSKKLHKFRQQHCFIQNNLYRTFMGNVVPLYHSNQNIVVNCETFSGVMQYDIVFVPLYCRVCNFYRK